jgi:hypothetical protein
MAIVARRFILREVVGFIVEVNTARIGGVVVERDVQWISMEKIVR